MAFWKVVAATPLLAFQPAPEPEYVKWPGIVQVICDKTLGTAFRIAPHKLVSVTHVTKNSGCEVDGAPLHTDHEGPGQDFSLVSSPRAGRDFLRVDCGGIVKGEFYWALGYARGWPKIQRIILFATGEHSDTGMAILRGRETVIPGQSGGPILNRRGEVVGTVNAFNPFFRLSFVRALKDTALCRGSIA